MADEIFRAVNIHKSYPGVLALQGVDFAINAGEIHALVGENGSGKSTLMKIIAGVYHPERGEIYVDGQRNDLWNPVISQRQGISIIYQELCLFDDLSVAENVFIGHEGFTKSGRVQWARINAETSRLLGYLKVDNIDPYDKVENLSVAQRQIVEIVKALAASHVRILLMDEPTSALSPEETENLFRVMRKLKEDGVGIVFISHKLEEVLAIADRATVLRDGVYVGSRQIGELSQDDLIRMMIGRDISSIKKHISHGMEEKLFEVSGLTKAGVFRDISFTLHKGEILGLFGLVGAKRSEVAQAIFGLTRVDGGAITLGRQKVEIKSSSHALQLGLGLIPEDRSSEGLILDMGITENVTLPVLKRIFRLGVMQRSKEDLVAQEICQKLNVKAANLNNKVDSLSGGNKQKVVLAKWILTEAKVLIFDEPTKGIDVGAKDIIHKLMRDLASEGLGIIMISSELPEIIRLSDNVIVMSKGMITGRFTAAEATEDRIIRCASGYREPDVPEQAG